MKKPLVSTLAIASCIHLIDVHAASIEKQNNPLPMEIGLSALFSVGAASVADPQLETLQTGGHDPKRIGFNLQNLELSIGGAVDPYFDAQANFVMLLNESGESIFEVEEAYLLSKRLPANLQLKAGQYYTEFGRQNATHPHTWSFIDQPLINSRVLGADGLRSQGARFSWLSPLPWYGELIAGVQNAKGSTGTSFLGEEHAHGEEEGDAHTEEEFDRPIDGVDDFLYSVRLLNGFEISETISANFGISAALGPNAESDESSTQILGADFYLKWQALRSLKGYPFIAWHSEFMRRDYELADVHVDDGHDHGEEHDSHQDQGWFSQISVGFKPGWVVGYRFENVWSNSEEESADTAERVRSAVNLTWFPTEYSKIRLQYNFDQSDFLDEDVHAVWLQFEYNLGSHAAHVF